MSTVVDRRIAGLATYHHQGEPGSRRVVFVHGSMDRGASFLKVARRLADLDLVRYDRRGYGRSVGAGVGDTVDVHVQDLVMVMAEEPCVLVGHSLGGVVALTAAQRRPDLVECVAAFEAPMAWMAWWPKRSAGAAAIAAGPGFGPEEAAERFMRSMVGDQVWERLPPRTRSDRRSEGRALLADLAAIRSDPPYEPSLLEVPVVAGMGSESRPHHREAAMRLATTSPGGELVVIDGAGHGAHASHPDDFASYVRRALSRA